ncbi:hypothetical protein BDV09DRAFT_164047 [Aspergillus tetrazonus]
MSLLLHVQSPIVKVVPFWSRFCTFVWSVHGASARFRCIESRCYDALPVSSSLTFPLCRNFGSNSGGAENK